MVADSLLSLKEEFEREITPLDVLAGVLYFFGDNVEFTTNYEKIHRAFNELRDTPLLKEFIFLGGGPYPYSELLENVFSRLSISGLIRCENPDYRRFRITEEQRRRIEESVLKKFSNSQREQLREISRHILERL